MLIATQAIFGCSLENGEQTVGTVKDLFFDGKTWIVRHLVVDTGSWLSGRRVLLPPSLLEQRDWPNRRLWIPLTKEQVKDCPPVETHLPVSRRRDDAEPAEDLHQAAVESERRREDTSTGTVSEDLCLFLPFRLARA